MCGVNKLEELCVIKHILNTQHFVRHVNKLSCSTEQQQQQQEKEEKEEEDDETATTMIHSYLDLSHMHSALYRVHKKHIHIPY